MSLEQWKEEYFPGGYDAVREAAAAGPLAAAQHSLNKWRGVSPEVLEEYDLRRSDECVTDGNWYMPLDEDECALCEYDTKIRTQAGRKMDFTDEDTICVDCPLRKVTGVRCSDPSSPYWTWRHDGDNRPMVAALEATVAALEAGTVDLG